MAKLTRAQIAELARALSALARVQSFLASDRIAVCRVESAATTTMHYTRSYVPGIDRTPADARPLYRIAKDIGSDLALLPTAMRSIQRLLAEAE